MIQDLQSEMKSAKSTQGTSRTNSIKSSSTFRSKERLYLVDGGASVHSTTENFVAVVTVARRKVVPSKRQKHESEKPPHEAKPPIGSH